MVSYVVIKTAFSSYKCHAYRVKNNRVYFNGHAVNLGNVMTITEKDGSVSYKNPDVQRAVKRTSKATVRLDRERKPSKKSKVSKEIIVI